MKDGGYRRPSGVLLLHEAVGIQPSAVRRELAGHLLRGTRADPWFGRASIQAERECGGPPRNDSGAGDC